MSKSRNANTSQSSASPKARRMSTRILAAAVSAAALLAVSLAGCPMFDDDLLNGRWRGEPPRQHVAVTFEAQDALTVESRGESSHGSWRLESESLALTYFVDGSRRLTTVQVTELTRRRLCWRGGAPADAYDLTAGADTVCWVRA